MYPNTSGLSIKEKDLKYLELLNQNLWYVGHIEF